MTRGEAINIISQMIKDEEGFLSDNTVEAHKMAIQALSQEPCEDAISREWLKIAIHNFYHGLKHTPTEEDIQAYIDAAPPVNPTKTGHWIDDNENEIDAQYGRHLYKCSECNEYADMFVGGTEDWWDIEKPNYCPNCGCRMIEPQERSGHFSQGLVKD